jgi:hypothetical protein
MDFDTFFATSWSDMLARALMLVNCRHDAEDAVQEAYAEALRGWDRVSKYDNPGAWVYRVVRQRLWKSARRWRRIGSVDLLTTWQTGEGDPVRFVEAMTALTALAALPTRLLIPTIVLLYGIDIKTAGSLSLLVSLPTMLVAFAHYTRDSSFTVLRANLRFTLVMVAGSIAGSALGGLLLGVISDLVLIPILAAVLLVSAVKPTRHD